MTETAWIFECPDSQFGATQQRRVRCCEPGHASPDEHGNCESVLRGEGVDENEKPDQQNKRGAFLETLFKKVMTTLNVEELDDETTRIVERIVVLRVATKHINLWMRQLEMKRREIIELAGLMRLDEVKREIEKEKNLERLDLIL